MVEKEDTLGGKGSRVTGDVILSKGEVLNTIKYDGGSGSEIIIGSKDKTFLLERGGYGIGLSIGDSLLGYASGGPGSSMAIRTASIGGVSFGCGHVVISHGPDPTGRLSTVTRAPVPEVKVSNSSPGRATEIYEGIIDGEADVECPVCHRYVTVNNTNFEDCRIKLCVGGGGGSLFPGKAGYYGRSELTVDMTEIEMYSNFRDKGNVDINGSNTLRLNPFVNVEKIAHKLKLNFNGR